MTIDEFLELHPEMTAGRTLDYTDHSLQFVRKYPKECTEGVTRKGEFQPCDKPAVAVRTDPVEGGFYPVCSYHARGPMLPLFVVLELARG